jgi:hypothetical protein
VKSIDTLLVKLARARSEWVVRSAAIGARAASFANRARWSSRRRCDDIAAGRECADPGRSAQRPLSIEQQIACNKVRNYCREILGDTRA